MKLSYLNPEWRYISGVLGFKRILNHSGIEISDDLEFDESILKNFHKYYFKYFEDTYNLTFNQVKNLILNRYLQNESIYGNKIKGKDLKDMYFKDFIEPILNEQEKRKFTCISCNCNTSNYKKSIAFIRDTGFDIIRKSSNSRDYYIIICNMCRLIYTCIPAGFTNVKDTGLFINDNLTFTNNVEINNKLLDFVNNYNYNLNSLPYKFIIDNVQELTDVQLIFNENNTFYNYFISKKLADKISSSIVYFKDFEKYSYENSNVRYFILNEIMKRLMNNNNLILYVNFLKKHKQSCPDLCKYDINLIEILEKELMK